MAQTDELLSTSEVADELGVSVPFVYQLRRTGRGPISYHRGKRLVFRRSDLEAYLAREREATLKGSGL